MTNMIFEFLTLVTFEKEKDRSNSFVSSASCYLTLHPIVLQQPLIVERNIRNKFENIAHALC